MIDVLVKEMIEKNIVDENELIGCSQEEIIAVEAKYNIKLPESYKSFLKRMGKNPSRLVATNEYAIEYDSVLNMTEIYRKETDELKQELKLEIERASEPQKMILENEEILELPKNALLILCRLPSYEFYLIEANGGEDVPVFYCDGDKILKEFDSFWDVLKMFIKGMQVSR